MANKAQQVTGNRTNGVLLEKVNREHLLKVLKEKGIEHEEGAPNQQLVVTAALWFDANVPEEDQGECDNCGGASPMEDPSCCFCGEGAEPEKQAKAKGKKAKAEATSATPTALAKAAPAPLAKAGDLRPASSVLTERDLDERIGEIFKLKGETAGNYWLLGRKMADLKGSGLWQARLGDDKKPKYKSWDAFVMHELGMTAPNVSAIMQAATSFSEEQFRAMGHKKLSLILQAPKEDQPPLLERAKQGAGRTEIEREVRRLKKEKGHRRPDSSGKSEGRVSSQDGGGRKPREEKITVASILGKLTVKLYAKPAKGAPRIDPKEMKRAKRIGDVPFGVYEMPNGVRVYITIRENAEGFLDAIVDTRRPESDKA